MTSRDDALVTAFGMPPFLAPWADRFFEPDELRLVEALAAGPLPERDLLERLPGLTSDELARAWRRRIVDLKGDGASPDASPDVALAGFHARFDLWAMFEGWKDVPADVAAQLNEWELVAYQARVAAGPDDLAYLLLEEAEDIVRAVPHVYQWPCNCRAMFRRCKKPVDVCLRFGNERGFGWEREISRERAVEILRAADRAGLMHTGNAGLAPEEMSAICNCCTDCCFPHVAAERLGIADEWPRRRYRAVVEASLCTLCGRCAKRCSFGALTLGDGGPGEIAAAEGRQSLLFHPALCRGCGLCATGCPKDAITMALLEGRELGSTTLRGWSPPPSTYQLRGVGG